MKYFIFSIDDGTIYDRFTIELFNKHKVRATFNLNSGLSNFTWYLGNIPITRLDLRESTYLYDGHEVASHTLTHPYLDQLNDWQICHEVNDDIVNLNAIFNRNIESFATPFDTASNREIEIIKNNSLLSNIRMSEIDESFTFPTDPYHIKVTALDIDRALELAEHFIKDKQAQLFVYAGHSYDFFVNGNKMDKLEELIKKIQANKDIEIITMGELAKILRK